MAQTQLRDLLIVTADKTSPGAASTSYTSTPQTGFAKYYAFAVVATLSGLSSGGTLDVVIEHSPDGTNWYGLVHFPQLSNVAAAATYYVVMNAATNSAVRSVGKNETGTTMTLAVNTAAGSLVFDRWRVRYVSGSGVSVGVAQSILVQCWAPN